MAPSKGCVVLDRNPGLKLVLAESGVGWIPYAIERMDLEYHKHFVHGNVTDMTLSRLPSRIFHDCGSRRAAASSTVSDPS